MRIANPFENKQKNNSINNNNNNYNNSQFNNLPPSNIHNQNKINDKNTFNPPPPMKASTTKNQFNSNPLDNINNQTYQNNIDYKEKEEEYDKIMNEYETKIKPFNCSSYYISPISNIFPLDVKTYNQILMPLAISLNPLYDTGINLPLIDYGEKEIPRCTYENCRRYLNPFVKFIENGERWICNFCGKINKTEEYYYSNLEQNGIRSNINEKPELTNGSYEFVANKNFYRFKKFSTKAQFIFIFETSLGAIDSGFLSACIESVKDAVTNEIFCNGNNVKISIITYNTGVDFYSYGDKFTQPQMLTVNDEQIFLPTSEKNLIFNLNKEKEKILQILDLIQNNFNRNTHNQNIINNNCKDSLQIFTAVVGAYLLGKNNGGKIIIFSSSNLLNSINLMNVGLDKNSTKEQIAYTPHDKRKLGDMGINLTNKYMSCDIFASADNQINTLTLNQLCEYSNGHLYFYKKFNFDLHYKNIFNQIRRVLTRKICWEGVNNIKYSHGYKLSTYSIPILVTKDGILVFPTGDSDQNYLFTIAPSLEVEQPKKENSNEFYNNKEPYLYIQSSLLYSNGDGTKRVRVHNLCIPLSSNLRYIYKGMNSELITNFYIKNTIDIIYKTKNISNSINSTDVQFKHFIEKVLSVQTKEDKPLLQNLSYLPLYMIGILKHRIFCKEEIEKNYDLDISNYLRTSLQKMNYQEIISFICPSIYSLHEFEQNKELGTYTIDTGEFILPNIISLSKKAMVENGLYLIDNGYLLIIYVRKKVSQYIIRNLFGVENLSFLTMIINEENVFNENDNNEFKERIKNCLDYIRGGKSLYPNLIFVFEGAKGERIINECLIEDNYCNWFPMNYENFYKKYIKESSFVY